MNQNRIELSRYRIERAEEDLESARLCLTANNLKSSVNRSYYAIFHCLRAVLALKAFDAKKHSRVIAFFQKNFLK
jgi:uncharacterized protein (UPF0332 family)